MKNYPVIDVKATAENIKRTMKKKNMTVKDVQAYFGFESPQSVYHWLDGRSLPTVDHLYSLSELFEMPMDMIIRGSRRPMNYAVSHTAYDRVVKYYDYLKQELKLA